MTRQEEMKTQNQDHENLYLKPFNFTLRFDIRKTHEKRLKHNALLEKKSVAPNL